MDLLAAGNSDPAPLYALIGVLGAALVTAIGGVVTAIVSKKREAEKGLDAEPKSDIAFMTLAYQDLRRDYDALSEKCEDMGRELEEARDLAEYLMRELAKADAKNRGTP